MEDRGRFKSSARNAMQASLARPSMGGAMSEIFSASPNSPVIAFFFARGWMRTAKVTPEVLPRMAIMVRLFSAPISKSKRDTELGQIQSR